MLVAGLLDLVRPLIDSLIAQAEGLANGRGIFALLRIIEFISETIQILSLNHYIDGIGSLGFAAKGVPVAINLRLAFLKTWMDHDLSRVHIVGLPVLANVGRSTDVASDFISIHVLTDGHVSVVAARGNHVASSTNLGDGIGADFGCGCQLAGGCVHVGLLHHLVYLLSRWKSVCLCLLYTK